jgi:hypothetical protein
MRWSVGLFILLALAATGAVTSTRASAAEAGYQAYVACEMNATAPRATSCQLGDHLSAFFEATQETEYVICVRFPSGKTKCSGSEVVPPGALFANRIYSTELGTEHVTWLVDERVVAEWSVRVDRSQVRLATQLEEAPLQVRPPFISYTGDGTGYLGGRKDNPRHVPDGSGRSGLDWISWGSRSAIAHGWDWLNNCRPDCAEGSFHRFRAIVLARRPRHGLFTRMTIKTRIGGRWRYDHRILDYSPPERYGGEEFPAYWTWGICGSPYTRRC